MSYPMIFLISTINQLIARQMISRFNWEDINDPQIKSAINYWIEQL